MVSRIHNGTETVEDLARQLRDALGTVVVSVRWFGSRAHGGGTADSDFDILIETARPLTPSERNRTLDIVIDLSAERDCLMDVHYYTTRELHDSPFARTPFVDTVLAESVVL